MKSTQTLTTDSNHTNVNKDVLIGEIEKGGVGEGPIQDGFDGFVDGIKAIPGNIVDQFKGLYSLKDANIREEVFNNFIYLATLSTEEKSKLWDDIRNSDYEKAKFTSSLLGEAYLMSGVSKLVSLSKNSVVNYFDDVSLGAGQSVFKNGNVTADAVGDNLDWFSGKNADEIADALTSQGYDVTVRTSTKSSSGAQIIEIHNNGGGMNITQVQVSPGGGRHGSSPYIKISTSDQGIFKIVDGAASDYISNAVEKAKIFFTGGN